MKSNVAMNSAAVRRCLIATSQLMKGAALGDPLAISYATLRSLVSTPLV